MYDIVTIIIYGTIAKLAEMMKTLFLISVLIIVCNCASNKPDPKLAKVDPDNAAPSESANPSDIAVILEDMPSYENTKLFCTRKAPTGSLIPTTTCRSKAEIEAEEASAKAIIQEIKALPPLKP